MSSSKINPVKAAAPKPSQMRRPLANINALIAAMHHNGKKASRQGSSAFCHGPGASQHTSPVTAAARKKPAMLPASTRDHISGFSSVAPRRLAEVPQLTMPSIPTPSIEPHPFPTACSIGLAQSVPLPIQGQHLHAANGAAKASGNAGMRHTLRPRKPCKTQWRQDWTAMSLPLITGAGGHSTRVAVITPPLGITGADIILIGQILRIDRKLPIAGGIAHCRIP